MYTLEDYVLILISLSLFKEYNNTLIVYVSDFIVGILHFLCTKLFKIFLTLFPNDLFI